MKEKIPYERSLNQFGWLLPANLKQNILFGKKNCNDLKNFDSLNSRHKLKDDGNLRKGHLIKIVSIYHDSMTAIASLAEYKKICYVLNKKI